MVSKVPLLDNPQKIIIIGAGVSGLALSILLGKLGFTIEIYERRSDAKSVFEDGRTINFTLTERGLSILREIGLLERVLAQAVVLKQRAVHFKNSISYQSYGKHAIESIKRRDLIVILQEEATKYPNIKIRFKTELIKIDKVSGKIILQDIDTHEILEKSADFVVGADGVFSKTREHMVRGLAIDSETHYFPCCYQELTLSKDEAVHLAIAPDSLHVWSSKDSILVAIPNIDQSFSCVYVNVLKNPLDIDQPSIKKKHITNFKKSFAEIYNSSLSIQQSLHDSSINNLVSCRVSHWYYKNKIILIGDACHSIYPFYGQGMNSALEDCLLLSKAIMKYNSNYEKAFAHFQQHRKQDCDALAYLAAQYFYVLKKSTSFLYTAQLMVDSMLNKIFPAHWQYEYQEVAHTRHSYHKILQVKLRQNKLRCKLGIFIIDWIVCSYLYLKAIRHDPAIIWDPVKKLLIKLKLFFNKNSAANDRV